MSHLDVPLELVLIEKVRLKMSNDQLLKIGIPFTIFHQTNEQKCSTLNEQTI